jgi:hypothetical protein
MHEIERAVAAAVSAARSHEIERVAEESTSGREDGQRADRGDKEAKPSPLNFASCWPQLVRLLNV